MKYNIPAPEPGRKNPRISKIVRTTYGIVAVKYTTWNKLVVRDFCFSLLRECFQSFPRHRHRHIFINPGKVGHNVRNTFPEVFTPFHKEKYRMVNTAIKQRTSCQRGSPRLSIPESGWRDSTPRLFWEKDVWDGILALSVERTEMCLVYVHGTRM